MGDTTDNDRELEREIRAGREFSMAEALGRLAGPGVMKGASPVSRVQDAQATVSQLVRGGLRDTAGALTSVLVREISHGGGLLARLDQPRVAVIERVRQILASEAELAELVRATDAEWGSVMGERPFFERDGAPAHPDDPYTLESVRATLTRFVAALENSG